MKNNISTESRRLSLRQTAGYLKKHDNYIILTHASPDGDTLGSAYALALGLISIGKKAYVVCNDEIPSKYDYITRAAALKPIDYKTIISVDVADAKLAQVRNVQLVGGGTASQGVHTHIAKFFTIGHGSCAAGVQHDQKDTFHKISPFTGKVLNAEF